MRYCKAILTSRHFTMNQNINTLTSGYLTQMVFGIETDKCRPTEQDKNLHCLDVNLGK